jgi:hypothetical protein
MLAKLAAWWQKRREYGHERDIEREIDERSREGKNPHDQGPGGWAPLGDLSKLSEDE